MTDWTPQRVLAAAAEWVWVPPDADEMRTDDYHLIKYPAHFTQPTSVAWSRTQRPLDEVVDEVSAQVRDWGRHEVYWWISSATSPATTEAELRTRGAVLGETVAVLAYDLSTGAPDLKVPPDVRVELVRNEATFRAVNVVESEVWDAPYPDAARLSRGLRETRAELAAGSGFRVLAWIDDEPVAQGGCSLVGDVARLWGAGTRAAWRHHGAYRAVLAERLRLASQHGARLALVKGRVETSGPILQRVGFRSYGEERCYRLPVA